MIRFDRVSFSYGAGSPLVFDDVSFTIAEAELVVVVGPTGSGKSTLLGMLNGQVPHLSGGTFGGEVTVGGRSVSRHHPRDFADLVGVVVQDPRSSFVASIVEDELVYVMENLGVDRQAMRRRVEDVLDLLSLHDVRDRHVTSLSGGQRQRVAIAAALTASPALLVLDEPTSALDPASAEEVLGVLSRLVHDLGITVVVSEHRLERVLPMADAVLSIAGDTVVLDAPLEAMAHAVLAPPVVELSRLAGWRPLALTVREARRCATALRHDLEALASRPSVSPGLAPSIIARDLHHRFGDQVALDGVSFELARGEVTGLMGRNGSGKTTLLRVLAGAVAPSHGAVWVDGGAPAALAPAARIRAVGLVPQDPSALLYCSSVALECSTADRDAALPEGTTYAWFCSFQPGVDAAAHPRDLSEGQRLCLALAVICAAEPGWVVLDEPTRGLDYAAKTHLAAALAQLAAAGHGVLVASHDVEFVAGLCQRVLVLAEGEIVADGPTREVVCASPIFAPQVAKVLAPLPVLTVAEVANALEERS